MPFQIIRDDITHVWADVIVNTANPDPVYGAGTDQAIYLAAGEELLLKEREKIGVLEPGAAAITPGFALPARYVIHTVGPVWEGGDKGEKDILASCYQNCLELAKAKNCQSIAFPLISSGVYGFPKDVALDIALREIANFLEEEEMQVTLVVFDRKSFEISKTLVEDVAQYIDEKYVEEAHDYYGSYSSGSFYGDDAAMSPEAERRREEARRRAERRRREAEWYQKEAASSGSRPKEAAGLEPRPDSSRPANMAKPTAAQRPAEKKPLESAKAKKRPSFISSLFEKKEEREEFEGLMIQVGKTFQEKLFELIDDRGLTDAEVYKRANLDRKLFSKIRCNPHYKPGKRTALALAVALELNLDETVDLLGRAEMALSPSSRFDLILEYCIEHEIYDIFEINALLFSYEQPLLGA